MDARLSPKQWLDRFGLRPQHRHGQNFLVDPEQLRRIVAASGIGEGIESASARLSDVGGRVVLEVGPGTGVLTEALLAAGGQSGGPSGGASGGPSGGAGVRVVAVEVDRALEPLLRERFDAELSSGRLRLVFDDVLDGKHAVRASVWSALRAALIDATGEAGGAGGADVADIDADGRRVDGFDLVANLPYHVATPLIVNLLVGEPAGDGPRGPGLGPGLRPAMRRGVVMVQKEVADRLTAEAGKDYGSLSVVVRTLCEVERVSVLGTGSFWPPPTVSSAVVRLQRRANPAVTAPETPAFSRFVQSLFGKRRKQVGAILRAAVGADAAEAALSRVKIEPTRRPERITVDEFVALWRAVGEAG